MTSPYKYLAETLDIFVDMRKFNNEIEKDANDLLKSQLRNLFRLNNLRLAEHPTIVSEEQGIDFFFEVFNRIEDSHELIFLNQNKGTNEKLPIINRKNHPEKGKISFQLELKHAEYFYSEMSEPLIFTLCDINNNVCYWHAIQLDKSIPKKIEEQTQNNSRSLQIYISTNNIINSQNFPSFLKDIKNSKQNQLRKHKTNFKVDYRNIVNKIKGLHIIDQIYTSIDMFQIPVIPTNIISSIPPFKGSLRESYIYGDTLHTDNKAFFDFMSSLSLKNEKLETNIGNDIKDLETKLKGIMTFFKANTINHVKWNGKGHRDRICVHDLFTSEDCNCERCNYDRLNFVQAHEILNFDTSDRTDYELLRKGYTHYLMGDLRNSILTFKEINNKSERTDNPIIYTISKYNLIHLNRFLDFSYMEDDRESLKKELEGVNFELDEIFIIQHAPHFIEIFNLLKNDSYFHNTFKGVDRIVTEIQKISFQDKLGSRYENEKVQELRVDFLRILCFLEFNFIIFNQFYEYKVLTNKILEGFVALFTLRNPDSSHYEKFELMILIMWFSHVDFKQANYLLHKYDLKQLDVSNEDKVYDNLLEYIKNLTNSVELIQSSEEASNNLFTDKLKSIVDNFLLILSRLKLEKGKADKLISECLNFMEQVNLRKFVNDAAINQLVNFQDDISLINLRRIIELLNIHGHELSSAFSMCIERFSQIANETETKEILLNLLETKELTSVSLFKNDDKAEIVSLLFFNLDIKTKKEIVKIIELEFTNDFRFDFYYIYTIYGVIELKEKYIKTLINLVPDDTKKDERIRHFFGDSWRYNYKLDQLINLLYKYDFTFTQDVRELSKKSNEKIYYDWLMNLEGFDYSNFDVYWVLRHKTIDFFKAFSNSPKLKKAIESALKENYIEGVAKIYFNELS